MSWKYGHRYPGPWCCAVSVAKKSLRIAGSLLSIGCMAWIAWDFYSSGLVRQLSVEGAFPGLGRRVVFAVLIYALAVFVLGLAWSFLQRVFVEKADDKLTVATYLVTQAYKYLPGGVFQYLGRHAALRKLGMSHGSLVLCASAEAACLVAVAVGASASFADHFSVHITPLVLRIAVVACVCVGLAGVAWLRCRVQRVKRHLPRFSPGWLIGAIGLYGVFFLLMALTLKMVVPPVLSEQLSLPLWAAVAAASWVAGFIVVGAPAGLGVRETVFIALLASIATRPSILLMAASFRVATFGGDVLAWGMGLPCRYYLMRTSRSTARITPDP